MKLAINNTTPKARQSIKIELKKNIKIATLKDFADGTFFAAADRPFQNVPSLKEYLFCPPLVIFKCYSYSDMVIPAQRFQGFHRQFYLISRDFVF